mgnify:CR=1 FL=1
MKVSDVVQHADLSLWAEVALVMFLGAFLVVSIRALRGDRSHAKKMAGAALDLEDEQTAKEGGLS